MARTYQIVKPFSELTVLENVMVGAFLRRSRTAEVRDHAEEVLKTVGLIELRHVVGKDLNLPQLKRMELACALATQPELLMLDEVMAGLNPVESAKVIDLVRSIGERGTTLLIIEHVMKAIMSLSHRVYVMNQGKVIAENWSTITRQERVLKGMEAWGLSLYQDQNGKFIVLPDGMTATAGWSKDNGKTNLVKLEKPEE